MKKYLLKIGWALLAASLLLSACGSPGPQATPTTDSNLVLTAAAQTANARITERAMITPSATPEPPTPTFNLAATAAEASTLEAMLTQAAAATPTTQATTTAGAVPTTSLADQAQFVSDVTVPDGTDYNPGASFTKTWRIKNIGSSTWTTDYQLAFISGDKMGAPDSVRLSKAVAPGETIDVSVDMVAPNEAKRYRGYWKMLNPSGRYFDSSVYVEIDVVGSGTPVAGATATPTQSSGGSGGTISAVTIAVQDASVSGNCPYQFTFSASFTLNNSATVSYQLEAGANDPNFTINLPPAETGSYDAGTYTFTYYLEFSASVSGWARFHVTAPTNVTSEQVNFSLTCTP